MRAALQFWLHVPKPCMMAALADCHCWNCGLGVPAYADRRGDHAMVCWSSAKQGWHDAVSHAYQAAARLAKVGTSLTSVLGHCWRRLPDGRPDPTDRSKKRLDLVLYDFDPASAPTLAA